MASSLTTIGVFWACLSLVTALTCITGFYLPLWLEGSLHYGHTAYFGSFRRCNFPRISSSTGTLEIVEECGRYSSFYSIPSVWWQASTILVGMGCILSLIVALAASSALCYAYVLDSGTARTSGALQALSALLVTVGVALFPLGWDNREVQEACGADADVYDLGHCNVSWSIYLMTGSVFALCACAVMSFRASGIKPGSFRL